MKILCILVITLLLVSVIGCNGADQDDGSSVESGEGDRSVKTKRVKDDPGGSGQAPTNISQNST